MKPKSRTNKGDLPDHNAQLCALLQSTRGAPEGSLAAQIADEWQAIRHHAVRLASLARKPAELADAKAEIVEWEEDDDGESKPVTLWQRYSEAFDAARDTLAAAASEAMLREDPIFFTELGRVLRERKQRRERRKKPILDPLTLDLLQAARKGGPVNIKRLVASDFAKRDTRDFDHQVRQARRIAKRYRIQTARPGRPARKG